MDANDDPTKSLMALFLDPRTAPFAQTWITNDVLYGRVKEYTESKLAICLDDMRHVSDEQTLVITDLDAEEEDDPHNISMHEGSDGPFNVPMTCKSKSND